MEQPELDRCRGHCCRCFCLSCDIGELKLSTLNAYEYGNRKLIDDVYVLDMLIPLGVMSKEQVLAEFGISGEAIGPDSRMRFTCRHLLENGDCGAYESRPELCRRFPKNNSCQYDQCQSACFKKKESA